MTTADWREERMQQIRTLILSADPGVTEERKWKKPSNPEGVPTFYCDGMIGTLDAFKGKVKVTFAKGSSIPDPDGLFNASLDAGTMRGINVFEADVIDPEKFVALIRAAIAVNRG